MHFQDGTKTIFARYFHLLLVQSCKSSIRSVYVDCLYFLSLFLSMRVHVCLCVCAYVKNAQWALPMNTVAEPSKFGKECNGTVSLGDRNATKQGSWFNKLHFWTSKLFSPEFFAVTFEPRTCDQKRLTKRLFSSIKMHKQYNFT